MSEISDIHQYDDIIKLVHHQSKKRKRMPISDRAAQFSPFAALTGYDDAIVETARQTERKIELDEDEAAVIGAKLDQIKRLKRDESVTITFFVADNNKDGGRYVTESGRVRKIDDVEKMVVMSDDTRIPFEDIVDISGDWLKDRYSEDIEDDI